MTKEDMSNPSEESTTENQIQKDIDGSTSVDLNAKPQSLAVEDQQKLSSLMQRLQMLELLAPSRSGSDRRFPKTDLSQYKFWSTQPVVKPGEKVEQDGTIEGAKAPEEIRTDPYPLPKDFEWVHVDIENEKELKDVYELLSYNYVEDDDAMFRFDYSGDFLKWALQPPGWKKEWHVGVRVVSTKKLVAFISGIPVDLIIHGKHEHQVEINFLCVHKKLRSKRLAPVMIKEITRQVHLQGIFHAVYTAGVHLPTPVATCRYYHRSLNPKKLVEVGFSAIPQNMTMARLIRLNKLPDSPQLPGFRPMKESDAPRIRKLLIEYLSKFELYPRLSEEEVKHWFLKREGVVYSYVVEEKGAVTDFVSFYSVPSSVINNPKHSHINAAYLFYYSPKGAGKGENSQRAAAVVKDALTAAVSLGFDVMNCLEIMDNASFIQDLRFGRGDGDLHYYLYNYKARTIVPGRVGLVML